MDSASVINGITLQLDGVVVPSTITFSSTGGGAIQVAVKPIAPLAPGKTYDIVIASSVLDLLGQPLVAPVLAPFTTAAGAISASNELTITSFNLVEVRVSSLVPFEYAPQLLVTNLVGSSTVHVLLFALARLVSTDTAAEPNVCISHVDVRPGQTIQVFTSVDGSYPVLFSPQRRAIGSALARILYQRDGEAAKVIEFEGSIFSGAGPITRFPDGGTYSRC